MDEEAKKAASEASAGDCGVRCFMFENELLKCPCCGGFPHMVFTGGCFGMEASFLDQESWKFQCCGIESEREYPLGDAVKSWNQAVKNAIVSADLYKKKQLEKMQEDMESIKHWNRVKQIIKRGNDVEIRKKKDGIQVIEVTRKTKYST